MIIKGRYKDFIGEIQSTGKVRFDSGQQPDFWMEVEFTIPELGLIIENMRKTLLTEVEDIFKEKP